MPTVIDSLIVELSLDASGFTEQQRRAVESLRNFEEQAGRSSKRVEATGQGVSRFFRSLNQPLETVRRHFEHLADYAGVPQQKLADLGAQGLRTGSAVEAGALAGAAGLRVMGAAGLTAFAAVESLDKLMQGANERAQKLFGVGLGAQGAGMSINEFGAVSQALATRANVPTADTQNWLASIKQFQENALVRGNLDRSKLIALSQAGIANPLGETPEQMLIELAQRFAGEDAARAIGEGASVGQSQALASGLRSVGSGLEAAIAEERRRAPTDAQVNADNRLRQSVNNLDTAFDHLGRVMDAITNGPLAKLINGLAWVVDHVAAAEEPAPGDDARYAQETGDASQQGAWPSWQRFKWNVRNSPVGRLLGLSGGSAPAASADIPPLSGSLPNTSPSPDISPQEWAALRYISHSEGAENNPWNYLHNSRPDYYTASGYWQITRGNWRNYAALLGIDTNKYPDAISAPLADQARVAALMWRQQGPQPWSSSAGGSLTSGRLSQLQDIVSRAGAGGSGDASGASDTIAIGDSIAVGFAEAGRLREAMSRFASDRDDAAMAAVWGRTPAQVLATINATAAALRGKKVLLSSGASNDPSQVGLAAQQLDALLAAGANPELLGVGGGVANADAVNKQLADIAAAHGVPFGGPLLTAEGRVHPRDYGVNYDRAMSLIRSAGAGGTSQVSNDHSVEINGGITVNAPLREGQAIGRAVADEIQRNSITSQANNGMTP